MDPLGPQSEQYWSIGPQSEGPETFSSFKVPRAWAAAPGGGGGPVPRNVFDV